MQKRMKLLHVITIAFVIIAAGLMTMNRLNGDILVLEEKARETRLRQVDVESRMSDMQREVAVKDSTAYIKEKARSQGYMYPNEIRFVVVNKDVLYDVTDTAEVEIEIAEDNEG